MNTRHLVICLFAVVCGLVLAGDSPSEEPILADSTEIRLLLEIADSPTAEPGARNAAFNRLMAIGRPVLPHLEERLRLRAGDTFVDLLRGLAVLPEPAAAAPEPTPEEKQAQFGTANPDEVAKYLVDKYVVAKEYYTSGQYERALRLVQGILSVEPTCSMRTDLQKIKSDCEEKIAEASLLKPSVVSRQDVYRTKDRIDLTFRLEDLTPGPIDLDFNGTLSGLSRAPKNAQNFLHMEVTVTEFTPYGDSRSWNRTQTWEMKENGHLTPAAPWVLPVTLDTKEDQAAGQYYRTYTIQAELRPYLLRLPTGDQRGRRISFPPVSIGVFPFEEDLEVIRLHGLEILSEMLDAGAAGRRVEANKVFLTCLLLDERDKPKAVSLLMEVLGHPRTSENDEQLVISCLRQITRLPLENSQEAWLGWWREQEHGANPVPK